MSSEHVAHTLSHEVNLKNQDGTKGVLSAGASSRDKCQKLNEGGEASGQASRRQLGGSSPRHPAPRFRPLRPPSPISPTATLLLSDDMASGQEDFQKTRGTF